MKLSPTLRRTIETALPCLVGIDWLPLTGGRTNHLWRVGDQVVKVFDGSQASPLFPNDDAAEVEDEEAFDDRGQRVQHMFDPDNRHALRVEALDRKIILKGP